VISGVVGNDPGHQRLEVGVPAELLGIDLTVGHHHPAEVAGTVGPAHDDSRFPLLLQHGFALPNSMPTPSAGQTELLEAAYRYALEHDPADLSMRSLAHDPPISSSADSRPSLECRGPARRTADGATPR
jgi:hypothetical protein